MNLPAQDCEFPDDTVSDAGVRSPAGDFGPDVVGKPPLNGLGLPAACCFSTSCARFSTSPLNLLRIQDLQFHSRGAPQSVWRPGNIGRVAALRSVIRRSLIRKAQPVNGMRLDS